jgi:hypothetical protein
MANDTDMTGGINVAGLGARRLGFPGALLTVVIAAALLACAVLFVVHRLFPSPPTVWNADQITQIRSLQGTWQDSVGGKMIFTDSRIVDGTVRGKVTFVNVPRLFSWRNGPLPPSYGQGTWEITSDIGNLDLNVQQQQLQQTPGLISIRFGSGIEGTFPSVGLEVEGPASAPLFLCEYPDPADACTFRKSPDQR